MSSLPKQMRQTINQYAHAAGLRHELSEKARLITGLEQLNESGASFDELQAWLNVEIISGKTTNDSRSGM